MAMQSYPMVEEGAFSMSCHVMSVCPFSSILDKRLTVTLVLICPSSIVFSHQVFLYLFLLPLHQCDSGDNSVSVLALPNEGDTK